MAGPCPQCQGPVRVTSKWPTQRFCSHRCYIASLQPTPRDCARCHQPIQVKWRLARGKQFCSRVCEVQTRIQPLAVRLWRRVIQEPEDGCWLWTGAVVKPDPWGYGVINLGDGTTRLTHRVAWEVTYGPIPQGQRVLHRCDVRRCVRPDHLWLGTQHENLRDAWVKGRGQSGKLLADHVYEIRTQRAAGVSSQALSKIYGVTPRTIDRIHARERWGHLPERRAGESFQVSS
jgi:endogenous inhibitor of DNA gyrase (YacG/DUF329 family)